MQKMLRDKLASLPELPGVYFHKDSNGEIIYIGKAAVLKNRVRQYFQNSTHRDPKTQALIREIKDTDWMVVDSEIEALFLEAELIRRYLPRYNILLRDDKSLIYIRIDYDSDFPTVGTTRRPLDDGAKYFGPYLSSSAVNQALKALRRVFPYASRKIPGQKRATLYYHLGLDPGLEEGRTSLKDYRSNLRQMISFIEGKRQKIELNLEHKMVLAAKQENFEECVKLRNQLLALKKLSKQIIFSDKEFLDISKDHALNELVKLLDLKVFPKRIEGYDISHMQGTDVVASMVVFTNGVSNKNQYRKFKTKKEQNNDFENMFETISRRFSQKNIQAWGVPQLVLIDGGKGQLDSAIQARDASNLSYVPFIGLAKKEEQIVIKKPQSGIILNDSVLAELNGYKTESSDFVVLNIPNNSNIVKLLQRIRDESHRFAVTYHSILKSKRQTKSLLDDIPGIGPMTRKTLLKNFGNWRNLATIDEGDLERVIGRKKATILKYYFINKN